MTERRPAHESVPDFVERQIREAQERGEFDDLAGAGAPIPGIEQPTDELWWVRRKLREEHVADLPPALVAKRDRAAALLAIEDATSEVEVRRILERANETIRRINRTAHVGPPTATMPVDVEATVARWHATHPDRVRATGHGPEEQPDEAAVESDRRWFRRRRGGRAGRRPGRAAGR